MTRFRKGTGFFNALITTLRLIVVVGCVAIQNTQTNINNLIATHYHKIVVGCVAIQNLQTNINNLIATHLIK